MLAAANPEDQVHIALDALRNESGWKSVLDALTLPAYTTDADGFVTYWNRACVEFAGREPRAGSDRWCVTWQLYTMAGEPLPHEDCPMAVAIKRRRPVRDEIAIAKRPDGTRRAFKPYPTPLFDAAGELTGAVNILVDISAEQAGSLDEQALRCRRLARATTDMEASGILRSMARGYEDTAVSLREKA